MLHQFFLKPIILHGIYALNLEKRREKNVSFFEKGAGVILNCVLVGGILGGRGVTLPPAEDQRGIHIIL